MEKRVLTGTHFMLGNYAAVEGALAAGCNFFAGYPITPANEVSERMARRLPAVGGVFLQGEDELCSIYAVTSASLAGAKPMTATASAGFDYFMEGFEYGIAIEAPMVVLDVMRCRGENFATQDDVMQLRWGPAGIHEMIVLAPSSVQEMFDYTIKAFNLAEEYRAPVVVMSEMTISLMRERLVIPEEKDIQVVNRKWTTDTPDDYKPFMSDKEYGVPDFAGLGRGYHTIYSINPHDEYGGIDWSPQIYERLYKRIAGKITENRDKIVQAERFDLDDAEIALIAYGSEARPAREAALMARERGIKTGVLKLDTVWPVPDKAIAEVAQNCRKVFSVEMNMGRYATEIERICAVTTRGKCETGRIDCDRGSGHSVEEILQFLLEA
ncbi:ferredoxin oxidoreductase [Pyramidobacter sp. SM-530-WT-4B]|uniref:Ferredoxin oxidoreductase n=1 Tax=Pyramidobacter porci TaxID=2605789 RepID=A0A6L5Y959_9BACT|nr:transketolase C-terminal domain-containing protein [Pyramidobacter porci]MST54796.1 ferredoxin oxidoreductase [Pyramidobacter porci]